jgi:hypothetical protein
MGNSLTEKRKLGDGMGGAGVEVVVEIVVAAADLTEDPPTRLDLDDNPEVLRFDDDDGPARGNEDCVEDPGGLTELSTSPELGFPGFGGVCSLVAGYLEIWLPAGENEMACCRCLYKLGISAFLPGDTLSSLSASEGSRESIRMLLRLLVDSELLMVNLLKKLIL